MVLNSGNQAQEERGLGSIRWEKRKIEKRFGCSFAYKTKDVDLSWVDVCLLRKQRKRSWKKKNNNNNSKQMNEIDHLIKIESKINKLTVFEK